MAEIMIVDDAAFMRMDLRKILEKGGHTVVVEAENGREAVEKYKDYKPDVVTMDITMPEMGGIEATKKIVEIDVNASIIMCSAMGQKHLVIEAIEAGACEFIVKPFREKSISQALNNIIRVKNLND